MIIIIHHKKGIVSSWYPGAGIRGQRHLSYHQRLTPHFDSPSFPSSWPSASSPWSATIHFGVVTLIRRDTSSPVEAIIIVHTHCKMFRPCKFNRVGTAYLPRTGHDPVTKLHDTPLQDHDQNVDGNKPGTVLHILEHIPLSLDLPRVDEIEDLHENEDVEDERHVPGGAVDLERSAELINLTFSNGA